MQPTFPNPPIPKPLARDINMPRDFAGNTYLHDLCRANAAPALIREAIAMGANLQATNRDKMSPLAIAIQHAAAETVAVLLQAGAPPYAEVEKGFFFNAAFMAIDKNRRDVLDAVLQNGGAAHVNKSGMSANGAREDLPCLHYACKKYHYDLIEPLIRAGAYPNAVGGNARVTPLQIAVENDADSVIARLVRSGADVNKPSGHMKQTPLHMAVSSRRSGTLETLLRFGANVDARDALGQTPLMHAVDKESLWAVQQLIDHHADVNAPAEGRNNLTPLMQAGAKGNEQIARALLKNGANPLLTDDFNRTAVRHAEMNPGNNRPQYDPMLGHSAPQPKTLLIEAEQKALVNGFEKKYRRHRP